MSLFEITEYTTRRRRQTHNGEERIFMATAPALLVLLWFALAATTALECQDKSDFARLLYKICSRSVLCKELYYLDVPHHNNTLIYERDFRRFQYQITQVVFFPSASPPPPDWDGQPLTVYIWPPEWQPPITLDYVVSVSPPCSESTDLSGNSTDSLVLIYVSLDLMKSYRQYISNEHYCNEYSERPIFDPLTGEFHCAPVSGKSATTAAHYRHLIFFLVLLNLAIMLIFAFGSTLIGIRLLP